MIKNYILVIGVYITLFSCGIKITSEIRDNKNISFATLSLETVFNFQNNTKVK